MSEVLIEYEVTEGAARGEVQRQRVNTTDALAAADRIRAAGGRILQWYLVADVRGLGEKPSGKTVRRRIEPPDQNARRHMSVIRACSECGGTDRQKCAECGGSGHGPKGACGRCDGQGSVSAASQAAKERARRLHIAEAQRSARTLDGSLEGYVIRVFFAPNAPGSGLPEVFPEVLAVAEVEKRRAAGAVVVAVYPDRYGAVAEALAAMRTADRKRWQRSAAARAQAADDAKRSEEAADERRRRDEFEAAERVRINEWTP